MARVISAQKIQSLATLPAGLHENRVMRQFGWLNVHFASSVCPTVMQCACVKFTSSKLMTTSRQLWAAPIMQAAAAISIMILFSFSVFRFLFPDPALGWGRMRDAPV
jgi:hypothetical protein